MTVVLVKQNTMKALKRPGLPFQDGRPGLFCVFGKERKHVAVFRVEKTRGWK